MMATAAAASPSGAVPAGATTPDSQANSALGAIIAPFAMKLRGEPDMRSNGFVASAAGAENAAGGAGGTAQTSISEKRPVALNPGAAHSV